MTTGSERKAKHRILDAAGYVHASGWINERDKPAFDRMVAEAKAGVEKAWADKSEGEE